MKFREKRRRKPNAWFLGDEWENDRKEIVASGDNDDDVDECSLRCFGRPPKVYGGQKNDLSKVK